MKLVLEFQGIEFTLEEVEGKIIIKAEKDGEMIEEKFENDELPAQNKVQFKKPRVQFKYENDSDRQKYIDQLIKDNLLTLVDVNNEVESMMDDIKQRSNLFLDIINLI